MEVFCSRLQHNNMTTETVCQHPLQTKGKYCQLNASLRILVQHPNEDIRYEMVCCKRHALNKCDEVISKGHLVVVLHSLKKNENNRLVYYQEIPGLVELIEAQRVQLFHE